MSFHQVKSEENLYVENSLRRIEDQREKKDDEFVWLHQNKMNLVENIIRVKYSILCECFERFCQHGRKKTVMFHFKIGKKIVCRMKAKQEEEKTL